MDVERLANGFAYVFNRMALGMGVLFGIWATINEYWWRAAVVFLVLIPVYFALQNYFDAP